MPGGCGFHTATNPIHDGSENGFADARQGLVAIIADQLEEPFLPELAKVVFRFSHAITEGQKNVTRSQVNRTLFVIQGVKQSHYGAAAIQATPMDATARRILKPSVFCTSSRARSGFFARSRTRVVLMPRSLTV